MLQWNAHKLKGDTTELQYSECTSYAPQDNSNIFTFTVRSYFPQITDHFPLWIWQRGKCTFLLHETSQVPNSVTIWNWCCTAWPHRFGVWIHKYKLNLPRFEESYMQITEFFGIPLQTWLQWNFYIQNWTEEITIVLARTLHLFRKLPEETARKKKDLSELPHALNWAPSNYKSNRLKASCVSHRNIRFRQKDPLKNCRVILSLTVSHNVGDIKCPDL